MTLIEAVREHLKTCPLLAEGRLNVDFLPPDEGSYSVEATPANPLIQRYIDGSSKRQFVFVLASTEFYGENIRQNLDNIGFYQSFTDWLEEAPLPPIDDGKTAQKMEALTSGYAFLTDTDKARYQIECRLIYHQRRNTP